MESEIGIPIEARWARQVVSRNGNEGADSLNVPPVRVNRTGFGDRRASGRCKVWRTRAVGPRGGADVDPEVAGLERAGSESEVARADRPADHLGIAEHGGGLDRLEVL